MTRPQLSSEASPWCVRIVVHLLPVAVILGAMVLVVVVVLVVVHAVCAILPGEFLNICDLSALEFTHAVPQRVCKNEVASRNIPYIDVTRDTSQCEMSALNDARLANR